MNSELEDLELDALLEDLQRDSDELDKLCLEFDTELNRLLELDEKNLQKLESIRQIRSLERALEVLASTFDRLTIDKKEFFIVLKKLSNSFFKLKKLSKKIILINHFKHLIEIFQMIKHENHLVLLQPRLQSINSIKA
jgi:prefoldin subunit 5